MTMQTSIIITGDTEGAQRELDELGGKIVSTKSKTEQLEGAQRRATVSAGQLRAGSQQLSYQIGDVAQQFALGVPPMTIFAQQGGQVIQAMTLMGGEAKGLLGLLGGPWGAVFMGAVTIAGALASSLLGGADAAREDAEAHDELKEAVDRLNHASAAENHTTRQGIIDDINRANSLRQREIQTRKTIQSALDLAIAEKKLAGATNVGSAGAAIGASLGRRATINALQKSIADQDTKIAEARTAITAGQIKLSMYEIAGATDAATAATQKYEDTIDRLSRKRFAGAIDKATFDRLALQAKTTEQAELDAARAHDRGASSARRHTDATKAAAAAERKLAGDLAAVEKQYDPVAAAAREYRKELAKIVTLEGAGKLSAEQASDYRRAALRQHQDQLKKIQDDWLKREAPDFARSLEADITPPFINVTKLVNDEMKDAGRAGAAAFRQDGIVAAQAIAQIFGGSVGGVLGPVFGAVAGLKSGNFNSVGGPLGGILTLLAGGHGGRGATDPISAALGPHGFSEGLMTVFDPVKDALEGVAFKLDDVFGERGSFTAVLGKAAGYGALGAGVGRIVGGSQTGATLGGVAGGFLGGELLGNLLGSAAGPVGSIAGGLLGGLLGGLFKKEKNGSTAITFDGGVARIGAVAGKGDDAREAASQFGKDVADAINNIVAQLGGTLGSARVSVGYRPGHKHGPYRVDPTGAGGIAGGPVLAFDDEAAALSYAVMDAIKDGAVTGLSAAVQKALRSSSDVDRALQEALKVQAVETAIGGIGAEMDKAFRDFERQAKERLRIARSYGFDVVAVEKLNAKERLQLQEQLVAQQVGSLQRLVEEMTAGSLFEGSAVEHRQALLDEIDKAKADLDAGVEGAADTLADLYRQLNQVSKDAYGTTGGFAADREAILDQARAAIAETNRQVADARKASDPALTTTNAALEENNQQNARMIAALEENTALMNRLVSLGLRPAFPLNQLARTSE